MLGAHVKEITAALLVLATSDATAIFAYPDDLKLHSSLTLFALISPEDSVFHQALAKFFDGSYDECTLELSQ